MGALQHILRTPLGLVAALCVLSASGIALFQAYALMSERGQALTFMATSSTVTVLQQSGDRAQELLLLGLSESADASATSTNDTIAMIGPMVVAQLAGSYAGLEDSGQLNGRSLTASAERVAKNLKAAVPHKVYFASDINTQDDTSPEAMLAYRADMRAALQPLLENTQNELDLFGAYMETADEMYLAELSEAAGNYRKAISAAALVVVPRDAVTYHRDILNALEEFTAVLNSLASHGTDALGSAALLRTYNKAEENVYYAFNALSRYYSQKS